MPFEGTAGPGVPPGQACRRPGRVPPAWARAGGRGAKGRRG